MSQDADEAPQRTPDTAGPLAMLHDLDAVPTAEHVARFEEVERALRARIDDPGTDDAAPGTEG
ncbi:hypothetical protein [Isoptericola dokdonensis]|jgi:hypothetical protein|uniref:Uncharacterized protein n=1 Tax=Isoptericola dokdonensis DS-3 TaxID=1300344 RepID=A0A161I074_9MICO|nr:hypothetical protein [Isoptericola dokdonensis]ANC30485.1 hypothetical protein I598_0910 [Isoptericola dokdonensis DS-3]